MNIHLHIDEVILNGLPIDANETGDVQVALEAELKHLLSNGALAPRLRNGGTLTSVPGENIHLVEGDVPADLGRQISRTVFGGIFK